MYKSGKTPSVDRVDPYGHYELKNMQIIEWGSNSSKARKPRRKYIIATNNTTKEKYILPGCWSKEAIGMGFDPSSIQKICKKIKGKGYNYKGFSFEYL